MDNSRRARENAEALIPGPTPHRSEKGTAGGIIAAEAAATKAKTERLRAMRMERDAANPPAPPKSARAVASKPATAKARKPAAAGARKRKTTTA